jgi:DNA-binding response OmpR family regulator/anti-sigma regulatory factor (Ser/Thr protein kinase)
MKEEQMTEQALAEQAVQTATLLIVEDDPDIQSALQDIFTLAGYTPIVASSGAAALEILEHEPVDLIVLDIMLPDMSGYAICEQVRGSMLGQAPIVMLTALTQSSNVVQGLSAGADDYIKKPFIPSELLLRVQNLLQRYQQTRTAEAEAAMLRDTLGLVQRQLAAAQGATQIEATLRQEFLHNVTTHMRALVGITEATVRKLPPGVERDAVQQLRSRIRGAALVYEISGALQHDPADVGALIRTIASALKSMYRPWKRVLLDVSGEPLELTLALASPLAMIVNELITNCFKHAFPDNRYGNIRVQYAAQQEHFTLDLHDDGVGADGDTLEAVLGRGRGLATVQHLLRELGGALSWTSSPAGTRVRLEIPLTRPDSAKDAS